MLVTGTAAVTTAADFKCRVNAAVDGAIALFIIISRPTLFTFIMAV